MAKGSLEFGASQKTPFCKRRDPILSPFFWPFPLNVIPRTFWNFNTKSEIHRLSYRDKLTCITPKLSK